MRQFPLSVVIIAKNESCNIRRCVEAVSWCDDVIVVDDHSEDDTARLAVDCGARVITNRFESFARQRNWAMSSAGIRNPWVLMLDADEVVTPALQMALEEAISAPDPDVVGFRMCRKTMFQGTWLRFSDGFPVWIVRLVRVGAFLFEDSGHGEVPVPAVNGRLGTLSVPFLHFPFSKGLHDWCDRHNRYSTREAEREFNESNSFSWRQLFSSDRSLRRQSLRAFSRQLPCRGMLRFLYQFICKGGILEGRAGLTFSRLMANYEALIVLKRREMELKRREGNF
ncbi:MAG: glycosyltransferase family 2 protein [Planctomycetes bacterium]|nr:glycosyltransferase family 2 protein [Planctomycetota bacterium]